MTTYSEQLRAAAQKAGIIDIDALALAADLAKDNGTPEAAAELVTSLKLAKPFLFSPKAKDMNKTERAEALAAIIKSGPKPEPMDISKTAREMTPAERSSWLREHSRRLG
jgi:hypothetical protein